MYLRNLAYLVQGLVFAPCQVSHRAGGVHVPLPPALALSVHLFTEVELRQWVEDENDRVVLVDASVEARILVRVRGFHNLWPSERTT